jgi:hypothetical protein
VVIAMAAAVALRRWRAKDIDALVHYADNRNIWLNLRDRFPHPYTRADAQAWIALCDAETAPILQFAIDLARRNWFRANDRCASDDR